MKQLFLIVALTISFCAYSQDDKTVTLVVSGQGKTQDEARQNALRSAIELAFGTFISSKTEILNDSLVRDEIVSVANGNIQKFKIISDVQIPNGDYVTSLKATVSVTKLTSFVENKGIIVEFKGNLFASNILIQELYESNEKKAISNVVTTMKQISTKSFDYTINAADPIFLEGGKWNIPITIDVIANLNFMIIPTLLEQTLKSISMSAGDFENYVKLNKPVFPITLATRDSKGIYYLRSDSSRYMIIDFIYSLNNSIISFYIDNGIEKNTIEKYNIGEKYSDDCNCSISNLEIIDKKFRIILKNRNKGYDCYICAASLFHNFCGSRHDSKIPSFDYKSVYRDGFSYSIDFDDCFDEFLDKKSNFYIRELLKKERIYDYPHGYKTVYRYYNPTGLVIYNPLGLVISFASINPNSSIVQFKFNDSRTIDEIKKIAKYKIIQKDQGL